ncbi:MAG: MOSC N-terminal beta barrel domain-containing protein [Gemmatales bacterium]|nr:MOSC N-terminal beta barrel domain-containing protein [Gemmatales bacterium]MCS7158986.1 MOSC N-terminal beta barrel domain-containing protein [Gemmatales bacterium]MDW8174186.1 MOSC N-terminal beta barrel domain-containing protein [Gemmatales bacterium]MDW8221845.1 MOSC N-terminal beta barrel domain-containing protein [Gemmatales bacterium]
MPVLSRIAIFPIKSLDALECEEVSLLPTGPLTGDRRYALFDEKGRYVNGKRQAAVHRLRVEYSRDLKSVRIRVVGHSECREFDLERDAALLENWLSDYFGFRVFLRRDDKLGFPDDVEAPGPTVITQASLLSVAEHFGWDLPQSRGRFRANLEIADAEPFWEDNLYAGEQEVVRFRIGEVMLEGTNPCKRCVVPTRDVWTGEVTPHFVERFIEWRRAHFPVWAEPSRFRDTMYRFMVNTRPVPGQTGKTLRLGDSVTILEKRPR